MTSRTPSALPAAPLHVPSADITVADSPAPSAMSSRIDWSSAAASPETGSSLMRVNASVGNASACALGEGFVVGVAAELGVGTGPDLLQPVEMAATARAVMRDRFMGYLRRPTVLWAQVDRLERRIEVLLVVGLA